MGDDPSKTTTTPKPAKQKQPDPSSGTFGSGSGGQGLGGTGAITDVTAEEAVLYVDKLHPRANRNLFPEVYTAKITRRDKVLQIVEQLRNYWVGSLPVDCTMRFEDFQFTFSSMLVMFANVGTSVNADFSDQAFEATYMDPAIGAIHVPWEADEFATDIITSVEPFIRRFCRYFAQHVAKYAKDAKFQYQVGVAHNVPPLKGYLGFDFADAFTTHDESERLVISNARNAGLFRSSGQRTAGPEISRATPNSSGNV